MSKIPAPGVFVEKGRDDGTPPKPPLTGDAANGACLVESEKENPGREWRPETPEEDAVVLLADEAEVAVVVLDDEDFLPKEKENFLGAEADPAAAGFGTSPLSPFPVLTASDGVRSPRTCEDAEEFSWWCIFSPVSA